MKQKKTIDLDYKWLKKQIDSGKSSHDVADILDISKSSVLRYADELGLKFKGKSHWRKI